MRKRNDSNKPRTEYQLSRAPRTPLQEMEAAEAYTYLQELRARLLVKQQRERDYLDRRAARGTRTPTDEAYEADQALENDLIELLEELIESAKQG